MSCIFLPTREVAKPDPAATGSQPTFIFPGSVWAQTVPATPIVKAISPTIVSNLLTQGYASGGNPSLFSIAGLDGVERYVVHGQQIASTIGWTQVIVNPGNRWPPPNGGSPQGVMQKPLPIGYQSTPASDHQLAIWDLDNHTQGSYTGPITHNFWVVDQPGQCNVEMMQPTDGSYSGFGGWSQDPLTTGTCRASGTAFIADVITYAEWLYGTIPHVLGLTVGNPTNFYVPPATASDGGADYASGGVPYGSLLYLPPGTPEPNWTATGSSSPRLAHMVFVCLQNYGMIMVDQTVGGGCGIAVEGYGAWQRWNPNFKFDGNDWPLNLALAYNAFKGMPWSSLQVIVPTNQLGSGGGGSTTIPTNGVTTGCGTTNPATITLPSTVSVGDVLVMFIAYSHQGWDSATPTGWTLMSSLTADEAGNNYACYTKTAGSGDTGGATLTQSFAGNALAWTVVNAKGSTGATLSRTLGGFGTMSTAPTTLSGTQALTLLWASVGTATNPKVWPDRYTQLAWSNATQSNGCAVFTGAAYSDVFVPEAYNQNILGFQVAV